MTPRHSQFAGVAVALVGLVLNVTTSWLGFVVIMIGASLMLRAATVKCRHCGSAVGRRFTLPLPKECPFCKAPY
jgi:hypothetical protein